MTHVHCPECGFQNLEAARFCEKCGAPVSSDAAPDPAAGEAWTAQVAELFPGCDIQYRPLPFSIGCHIGPGAFGLTVSRRLAR